MVWPGARGRGHTTRMPGVLPVPLTGEGVDKESACVRGLQAVCPGGRGGGGGWGTWGEGEGEGGRILTATCGHT